ncbi:MAG: response regulator [Thermodesulfobacteriota bacterium]
MGNRPPHEDPKEKSGGLEQGTPAFGAGARRRQRPPGGTERILLVDDERLLLELLAELLVQFGYTPLLAENGERALQILKEEAGRIDMVVLDLSMPGMGGLRCLQEMLGMDPGLKVLISSGYAASRKVNEAMKSGAAGFVTKPYDHAHILQEIREILDARGHKGAKRRE